MSQITAFLVWRRVATFLPDCDVVSLAQVNVQMLDVCDTDVIWGPIADELDQYLSFHHRQLSRARAGRGRYHFYPRRSNMRQQGTSRLDQALFKNFNDIEKQLGGVGFVHDVKIRPLEAFAAGSSNHFSKEQLDSIADSLFGFHESANTHDSQTGSAQWLLFSCKSYKRYVVSRLAYLMPATALVLCKRMRRVGDKDDDGDGEDGGDAEPIPFYEFYGSVNNAVSVPFEKRCSGLANHISELIPFRVLYRKGKQLRTFRKIPWLRSACEESSWLAWDTVSQQYDLGVQNFRIAMGCLTYFGVVCPVLGAVLGEGGYFYIWKPLLGPFISAVFGFISNLIRIVTTFELIESVSIAAVPRLFSFLAGQLFDLLVKLVTSVVPPESVVASIAIAILQFPSRFIFRPTVSALTWFHGATNSSLQNIPDNFTDTATCQMFRFPPASLSMYFNNNSNSSNSVTASSGGGYLSSSSSSSWFTTLWSAGAILTLCGGSTLLLRKTIYSKSRRRFLTQFKREIAAGLLAGGLCVALAFIDLIMVTPSKQFESTMMFADWGNNTALCKVSDFCWLALLGEGALATNVDASSSSIPGGSARFNFLGCLLYQATVAFLLSLAPQCELVITSVTEPNFSFDATSDDESEQEISSKPKSFFRDIWDFTSRAGKELWYRRRWVAGEVAAGVGWAVALLTARFFLYRRGFGFISGVAVTAGLRLLGTVVGFGLSVM